MSQGQTVRLIVNADDFGISESANRAIERAHREGILTSASLMVAGDAAESAVRIARSNPGLGVGLHSVLVCGRSVLPPPEIPGLVDGQGRFTDRPVVAGLRYFFLPGLREQVCRELLAQFERFRATGLPLDHVNGHLNFHLHPGVFGVLLDRAQDLGIRSVRLTRDPLIQNLRLASGEHLYRWSHAAVFAALSRRCGPLLASRGLRHAGATYGLLQNSRVTEDYLLRLLPELQPGTWELYCHADEDAHRHELEALLSPRVRQVIEARGIRLCRYSDCL
ncbi:MAG: hopanoid biosynthesis-associated protein HpnK [Verrucomicrobiota bacterium]